MALDKSVFNFLKKYSSDTFFVNSIIVSNFFHNIQIEQTKNIFINNLIIKENDTEHIILNDFIKLFQLKTFEDLIEAFEFVISPSDKIINGAVYTPKYIREYIVNYCLSKSEVDKRDIKIGDISCGCGGFLLSAAEHMKINTVKSYSQIFQENIFGIDIEEYSIERTKILLSVLAIINGEDLECFHFNLFQGNSLVFDWKANCDLINEADGFDIILGNPPYVCSRNLDSQTMELLKNIEVSSTGHPDLYIPFFQIGIENLNRRGILGYITVNTFIKSINGRALRNYFSRNKIDLTILNFGGEQLFKDRNTYTCICFISFSEGLIRYIRTSSKKIEDIEIDTISRFQYQDLENESGWNLVNEESTLKFINKIESTGIQFGKLYTTRNGIATLKNNIYKFKPEFEDEDYFYLNDKGIKFPIEKEICRDIVNANKLKSSLDITRLAEKIIFPYNEDMKIFSESELKTKFPQTYRYLLSKKDILSTRDKGNREYEEWFAYGRRQSLDINRYKLFFPHICLRPSFVLSTDKNLLFYNGIAVVSDDLDELAYLKKILESDIFFKYILNTTKDYSSGYISMSKNYIKNFGVFQMNKRQIKDFLSTKNVNEYLGDIYQVEI